MTQPTQALPPYLSASTFTITTLGAVSTGVTVVEVPLTYFGPSIPLGTNNVWTFGGSTSPPPSSMPQTSTAIPPTTAPSSIASTTSLPSTSALPSSTSQSSSSLSPTSAPLTSISSSSAPSSQSAQQPSNSLSSSGPSSALPSPNSQSGVSSHSNLHRVLPAIIIGSIIGAVLILFLAFLCCRRRRRRQMYTYGTSNTSDFVIVDAEGQTRMAGEGVARPTGEEEDSFLSRSGEATDAMRERDPSARLVSLSPATRETDELLARDGRASDEQTPVKPTTLSPGAKAMSWFGASATSLFYNPNRGPDPAVMVHDNAVVPRDSSSTHPSSGPSYARGPIMPARQLLEMDDEWQREAAAAEVAAQAARASPDVVASSHDVLDSPLRPPPVLNPDGLPLSPHPDGRRDSANTQVSSRYPDSPTSEFGEVDENATLLTARRVMMNEGGPGTLLSAEPEATPSSWGSSLGLGGLTRLSRLSWFQRMDMSRTSLHPSRPSTPQGRMLTDREVLAGRTMLSAAGLTATGERPLSYVSAHSVSSVGNTLYHSAMSSFSSRPESPLRNMTMTSAASAPRTPPADIISMSVPAVLPPSPNTHESPADITIDVLDMPAPPPTSQFSSTSSRGGPPLPPGLEHLTSPRSWRESSSDMPSAASFGTASSGVGAVGAVAVGGLDVLEDAPPRAGEGWSHLRTMIGGIDSGRRGTLGQPIYIDHREGASSEQGSLHSIPLGLSPLSPTAAGSHSQYGSSSYGSGSSRPSSHSHGRSIGSSGSLVHSNSISSDGRRRPRREAGEPVPPLPGLGRASLTAMGNMSPFSSPPRSPVAHGTHTSSMTGGTTTTATSDVSAGSNATHTTVVDSQTGAVMHFPTIPWTSGREGDWPQDAWTEIPGSTGSRWWGPPLRMQTLQRAAAERRSRNAAEDAARHT